MPFEKGNKLGFTSKIPLDKKPLTIRLDEGVRDKIKVIPGWQDKVRKMLKDWAEQNTP